MSTTVKFVYVHWMGKSVPFVKRGKFGVVQGSLEKQFSVSNTHTCKRLFDVEGLIFSCYLYTVLKFLSCLSPSLSFPLSLSLSLKATLSLVHFHSQLWLDSIAAFE